MNVQFDDPKLTAYALGEVLADEERQAVQHMLAQSPEARALVEDVRQLAAGLSAEFESERTTASPSRELADIIAFTEPHRIIRQTRSHTHLLRVAALVMASLAVASIAWFTIRPDTGGRMTTAKAPAAAVASTPQGEASAYLEMEVEGPAGPAIAARESLSYEAIRRLLVSNQRPPKAAVRIEEMVNHFPYRYASPPANSRDAIAVHLEVAGAPWKREHRLVRIGLKARETAAGVNLEVVFNSAYVAAYRLIGHEPRPLRNRGGDRDQVDVDDFLAGQAMTFLYEIVPAGQPVPAAGPVEAWNFRTPGAVSDRALSPALLTVKLRYQGPKGETRAVAERPLVDDGRPFDAGTADFKFAASVAGFGMLLRDSSERGDTTPAAIAQWAEAGLSDDPAGQRREFVELVRQAEALLAAGPAGSS